MNTDKQTAAALFAKVTAAMIECDFRGGPAVELVVPEYRNGWVVVNGRSWDREMATGEKYNGTQGGWAFI